LSNLIRRSMFQDPFFGLGGGFDQLMGNLWSVDFTHTHEQVIQREDATLLRLDMPGVAREDLKVELKGNTLKVTGTRNDRQDGHYAAFASIQRSWSLPQGIEPEDIQANLENGVLEISIPKAVSQTVEIPVGETLTIEAGEAGTAAEAQADE